MNRAIEHDAGDARRSQDYLLSPTHGPGPGVLVIHPKYGLTEGIKQLCVKLAHHGFVAYAPDLFSGVTPRTMEEAEILSNELNETELLRSLQDSVSFLRKYEDVSRRHVGVIGIGYGATLTWWLAETSSDFLGAAVVFYGVRDSDWGQITLPFQCHFAEIDRTIPPSRVVDLGRQLERASITAEIHTYEDTEPGFIEPDNPAFDRDATETALARLSEFFTEHLTR